MAVRFNQTLIAKQFVNPVDGECGGEGFYFRHLQQVPMIPTLPR
jgi:hypothetical protein